MKPCNQTLGGSSGKPARILRDRQLSIATCVVVAVALRYLTLGRDGSS
jgi:hypothetical protein